jgi:hypothetical protein
LLYSRQKICKKLEKIMKRSEEKDDRDKGIVKQKKVEKILKKWLKNCKKKLSKSCQTVVKKLLKSC